MQLAERRHVALLRWLEPAAGRHRGPLQLPERRPELWLCPGQPGPQPLHNAARAFTRRSEIAHSYTVETLISVQIAAAGDVDCSCR